MNLISPVIAAPAAAIPADGIEPGENPLATAEGAAFQAELLVALAELAHPQGDATPEDTEGENAGAQSDPGAVELQGLPPEVAGRLLDQAIFSSFAPGVVAVPQAEQFNSSLGSSAEVVGPVESVVAASGAATIAAGFDLPKNVASQSAVPATDVSAADSALNQTTVSATQPAPAQAVPAQPHLASTVGSRAGVQEEVTARPSVASPEASSVRDGVTGESRIEGLSIAGPAKFIEGVPLEESASASNTALSGADGLAAATVVAFAGEPETSSSAPRSQGSVANLLQSEAAQSRVASQGPTVDNSGDDDARSSAPALVNVDVVPEAIDSPTMFTSEAAKTSVKKTLSDTDAAPLPAQAWHSFFSAQPDTPRIVNAPAPRNGSQAFVGAEGSADSVVVSVIPSVLTADSQRLKANLGFGESSAAQQAEAGVGEMPPPKVTFAQNIVDPATGKVTLVQADAEGKIVAMDEGDALSSLQGPPPAYASARAIDRFVDDGLPATAFFGATENRVASEPRDRLSTPRDVIEAPSTVSAPSDAAKSDAAMSDAPGWASSPRSVSSVQSPTKERDDGAPVDVSADESGDSISATASTSSTTGVASTSTAPTTVAAEKFVSTLLGIAGLSEGVSLSLDSGSDLRHAKTIVTPPHLARWDSGVVQVELFRLVRDGGGQVVMKLTPPDESSFRIDLSLDPDRGVRIYVEGASDSVKTRLEQGAEQLREQFSQMGFNLQLDMRGRRDPSGQDAGQLFSGAFGGESIDGATADNAGRGWDNSVEMGWPARRAAFDESNIFLKA